MPPYNPGFMVIPTSNLPTYTLQEIDPLSTLRFGGSDTLLHPGDTLGLLVSIPVRALHASMEEAQHAEDSLSPLISANLQSTLSGVMHLVEANGSNKPIDSLSLDSSASNLKKRGDPKPIFSKEYLTKIGLQQPQSQSGVKAVLVVSELIVARSVKPEGPNAPKVLDVLAAWGLWDPNTSRWKAWGLVPLRKSRSETDRMATTLVATQISTRILQETPIPSSVGDVVRKDRRSRLGGLLLGLELNFGGYMDGDLKTLVKAANSDASVDVASVGVSVAWFPSNWGVGVSLPLFSSVEMSQPSSSNSYSDKSDSKSVKLFDNFNPEVELSGILPFNNSGLIGTIGIGHMSLTGSSTGWDGVPPSGSGWFWKPSLGYYLAGKYAFLLTDLGIESQSYDLLQKSFKATVFSIRIRAGLRLAHE